METYRATTQAAYPEDFHRKAASRGVAEYSLLTLSSKCQAGLDVFPFELRKITQNVLFSHSGSQILQDIRNRDPGLANARLSTSPCWVDYDAVTEIHKPKTFAMQKSSSN